MLGAGAVLLAAALRPRDVDAIAFELTPAMGAA
jgi:hypothetical protein